MFGQEYDLADVIGIVGYLAIDRLHDGVGFVADEDFAAEVGVGERGDGVEEVCPAGFPLGNELVARCGWRFEFSVAIAVGLFAVGGEEIGPAGAHVAVEVLDDDGDGIRFFVEGDTQRLVGSLGDGAFAEVLVIVEQADRVGKVRICEFVRHGGILHRFGARGGFLAGARRTSWGCIGGSLDCTRVIVWATLRRCWSK